MSEAARGPKEALRRAVEKDRTSGCTDALFDQGDPSFREMENLRADKRKDQFNLSIALEMSNLRQIEHLLNLELSFWKSSKVRAN